MSFARAPELLFPSAVSSLQDDRTVIRAQLRDTCVHLSPLHRQSRADSAPPAVSTACIRSRTTPSSSTRRSPRRSPISLSSVRALQPPEAQTGTEDDLRARSQPARRRVVRQAVRREGARLLQVRPPSLRHPGSPSSRLTLVISATGRPTVTPTSTTSTCAVSCTHADEPGARASR